MTTYLTIGKHTRTIVEWEQRREASRKHSKEHQEYYKAWLKNNIESKMLSTARQRAKKRGIEFNITKEDIILPDVCPILGIKLEMNLDSGAGGKENSYSLDRIDQSKGYIKGNIQVISHKANSMKFTASKEELLKFSNWITKTYA